MTNPLWKPNLDTFSVVYPITEILRRAKLKIKIHDRGIPMTSDAWGMFPEMIGRLRKFMKWEQKGIKKVEVFYDPPYFARNAHTIAIMDPMHTFWVKKYKAFKT